MLQPSKAHNIFLKIKLRIVLPIKEGTQIASADREEPFGRPSPQQPVANHPYSDVWWWQLVANLYLYRDKMENSSICSLLVFCLSLYIFLFLYRYFDTFISFTVNASHFVYRTSISVLTILYCVAVY